MVKASSIGRTEVATLVSGALDELMARAASFISTVTYMRATGRVTRRMVTGSTAIRMAQYMKACGGQTGSTVGAKNNGLMAANTRVSMWTDARKGQDHISGTTVHYIRGSGSITESKALAYIGGSMAASTRDNGTRTIWKAMVCTGGVTAENSKDSIKMIKSTAMECIHGTMAEYMKATGTVESSMDSEYTIIREMGVPKQDCGKMERESSGLLRMKLSRLIMVHSTIIVYSKRLIVMNKCYQNLNSKDLLSLNSRFKTFREKLQISKLKLTSTNLF